MADLEALLPSANRSISPSSSTSSITSVSTNKGHLYHKPHQRFMPFGYKIIGLFVLIFVSMQFVLNFSSYQTPFHSMSMNDLLSQSPSAPFRDGRKALSASSVLEELEQKRLLAISSSNSDNNQLYSSSTNTNLIVANSSSHPNNLETCPLLPPKLVGPLKVLTNAPSWHELEKEFTFLNEGGRFHPRECTARSRVAIIIPYRDREEHLRTLLYNLHPMLSRQQIDYGIFVVEETPIVKFNRAKLMNVGFMEALKTYDYQCFIFHDVDLIPEDDRNLYVCPTDQPRHMSVAVNTLNYRLPYKDIFGGVSALTKEMMVKVNGFSNEFWGWGGEDDDMANRIKYHGYKITRYRNQVARYTMLKHKKDTPSPDRYKKLYKGRQRFSKDGLTDLKYKVVKREFRKLYTWLLIDLLKDG